MSRKPCPENVVMREDGPVSAEQLARLACTLWRELAPAYCGSQLPDFDMLPDADRAVAIAVASRVLRRVDARMRYILGATRNDPFVGEEGTVSIPSTKAEKTE